MSRSGLSEPRQIVVGRLREAGLDVDRFIDVNDGEKRSTVAHTSPSNRHPPEEVPGNAGVYAGGGLVFLDVDDATGPGAASLKELPKSFTVRSPHADDGEGHRWYYLSGAGVDALREEFGKANLQPSWGEVRADNQYIVAPASTLTDCDYGCCTPESPGRYEISADRPIAIIPADELIDVLLTDPDVSERQQSNDSGNAPVPTDSEDSEVDPLDYDIDDVSALDAAIRDFQADDRTTPRAFGYLLDLVQGKYAKRGFEGDRSGAEYNLAGLLYGVLQFAGVQQHREELVYAYISEACDSHPTTDTGLTRKWVERGFSYRRGTVRNATSSFDHGAWDRWQQKRGGTDEYTGDYSAITYDYVLKGLMVAYMDRPGYPSKSEVVDVVQGMDPSRSRGTHERALRRTQKELGQTKLAKLPGNRWVYYPASEPDPTNAESVKHTGEEYLPD